MVALAVVAGPSTSGIYYICVRGVCELSYPELGMGASQSLNNTSSEIIAIQNRLLEELCKRDDELRIHISKLVGPANLPALKEGRLQAVIVDFTRADGSTVKELYIPDWFTVFYENNGKLGLRDQIQDVAGQHIELYEAHVILLHNALVRWREFQRAATVGANVLSQTFHRAVIPKL